MKKLYFSALAISLFMLLSCSDIPEENNASGSLLLLKIKSNEEGYRGKDIYKFNGFEYVINDGEEKGNSIYEFSDGTVINGKDEGWEKPDAFKGEYMKCVIEKIDKNSVVLLHKSYSEYLGKTNWRFKFKYQRGTYEDYLGGKTVELVPLPNEMERYDVSSGKQLIAVMSLNGFDAENSKANFTTKSSGMGLGLALVKNLVNSFGGAIGFDTSEKGTTFIIVLPLLNPKQK